MTIENPRSEAGQRVKKTVGVGLLVALALASACERDECAALASKVQTGDVFDVFAYGHDFSPFCAAGFEAGQDHARWVAKAWGEPPNPFEYMLFESREDACWPCEKSRGCATSTYLASTDLPHRHEIAHAVRGLPCPTLLEEGWAELYGFAFREALTSGDLRAAADSNRSRVLAFEFYPLAARFVAFLLETRGLDGLKQLCKQTINSSASLDSALTKVFGQSLDEIDAEFSNYPDWSLGQLRQDQACEGTDITSFPGSWTMNLTCGAPGVEGRDDGPLIAQHLVDLPEAGNYRLRFEAPVDFHVRVEFRSCAREGMASVVYSLRHVYSYLTTSGVALFDLPAGLYVFRFSLEEPAELFPFEVSVESWP